MNLHIYKASDFDSKLKCTIHKTGKLGFTDKTAKALKLSKNSHIKFASDDDKEFYLINCHTNEDEETFAVAKSGQYYYVDARALFDTLGIDYKNQVVMYDLSFIEDVTMEIYKMTKRIKPKAK